MMEFLQDKDDIQTRSMQIKAPGNEQQIIFCLKLW